MSKIYTSADQLIGQTPLLELTHIEADEDLKASVLAKLEYFNPAGSVKDRIAKNMLDDAERQASSSRLLSSSSRPPAIPASASPPWPPPAATGSSSSCPKPCPSSAAS